MRSYLKHVVLPSILEIVANEIWELQTLILIFMPWRWSKEHYQRKPFALLNNLASWFTSKALKQMK